MKVVTCSAWNTTKSIPAGSGKFAGIAIGMGSEEGVVRVNGLLLPSGRVLPLPVESGYTVEHASGAGIADYFAQTAPAYLELYLFECVAEMAAADVGRAKLRYTDVKKPATGAYTMTVPFSNRRHVMFSLHAQNGASITSYALDGYTFSGTQVANLVNVAGAFTDVAFHFGGTDHEEVYEQLQLRVSDNAAGDLVLQAHVIGDL